MDVFVEISLILVATVLVAGILQLVKQPLIIAYIITGVLLGPYFLNLVDSTETLDIFSSMGISLLLFIIGLSLNPLVIKEVGKISLITGIGQVVFTSAIGFLIAKFLGFNSVAAIYIAVALTFSSTIIIMKLLSDKKELGRLYGKISIGFLLVQDLIASMALIGITSFVGQDNTSAALLQTGTKIFFIGVAFYLITTLVLPKVMGFFAQSSELLFVTALGWGFGMATIAQFVGLSAEIGALFAGVALATSPYSHEISSKMKPLRDFFIILFFVLLGANMVVEATSAMLVPAAVFSLFILVGNPLIVLILMGVFGYRRETGFKAGLTVAQISEFSLVLVILGNRVGHLTNEVVSLVTIVGIFTITISTYLIMYADQLFAWLSPYLKIFERRVIKEKHPTKLKHPVILFGYQGTGIHLVEVLHQEKRPFLVVDFNPEVIQYLESRHIPCLFGDATSTELLQELINEHTNLVVSTIPKFSTGALIINFCNGVNKKIKTIVASETRDEGLELYDLGADYVIMPHYLSGLRLKDLMKGDLKKKLLTEKKSHLQYLRKTGAQP